MVKATITIHYLYSGTKTHFTYRASRAEAYEWVENWQQHARDQDAISTYKIEAC